MVEINKEGWKGLPGLTSGILTFGLILLTIGMASPYWNYDAPISGSGNVHGGLWKECVCVSQICKCVDLVHYSSSSANWLKVSQTAVVLGWLLLLAACVCSFIAAFINDVYINKTIQRRAQIVLCVKAAVFVSIGVALWGFNNGQHLHWAFGITIVAIIFSVIGGAISLLVLARGVTNNY